MSAQRKDTLIQHEKGLHYECRERETPHQSSTPSPAQRRAQAGAQESDFLSVLRVERLLGEMRLPKDSAAGRRELERQIEERRREESGGDEWAAIRRGWFCGADALKEELLARASERVGAQHYWAERQESGEAKAERLVREELAKLGWTEAGFTCATRTCCSATT